MSGQVHRGDWVTVGLSEKVGFVLRCARDGSWADVDWGFRSKRMQTAKLQIQTTITAGPWTFTDLTRQEQLSDKK